MYENRAPSRQKPIANLSRGALVAIVVVVVAIGTLAGIGVVKIIGSSRNPVAAPIPPSVSSETPPGTFNPPPVGPSEVPDQVAGRWTGVIRPTSDSAALDLVLDLQVSGSKVVGTLTATDQGSGNRGVYGVAGTSSGTNAVITGYKWIKKPNDQWTFGHFELYVKGDDMRGSISPAADPANVDGTVTAHRSS